MSNPDPPDPAYSPRDVLDEVGQLATRHDWSDVASFVTASAGDMAQVGVLVTAGTDATELIEWLGAQTSLTLDAKPMEQVAADPGSALHHERMIVVGRCGVALGPDDTEALSHLAVRPHQTVLVVFIDADKIGTVGDMERIDRGIRRTVAWAFGDYDAGSVGGPPTVLWAKSTELAPLRERLEAERRDHSRVARIANRHRRARTGPSRPRRRARRRGQRAGGGSSRARQ